MLEDLLYQLLTLPQETEWVEFKHNFHSEKEIGERISAISNSALLLGKQYGYLVYGIEDKTHKILGTSFKAKSHKIKNPDKNSQQELETFLLQRLNPKIDFQIEEFDINEKHISMFIIPATVNRPVEYYHDAYIRVGTTTRKLKDFPEKARKIWLKTNDHSFEETIALPNISAEEIIELLDTQSYFTLMNFPYPSDRSGVLDKFLQEKFILQTEIGFSITNLGAMLFAKDLNQFEHLKRKSVRVIVYAGNNRVNTIREQIGNKGYATGFAGLINWINSQLPSNEIIGEALRKDVRMFPEIAIRELVANALIHQDFSEKGFPMIEIFTDRIEISNAGLPLIEPNRFIDEYQSRNEKLADILRRTGICEEKGSGIDKVIDAVELYQLPAPSFVIQPKHTKVILYAYKKFQDMEREDKIRATFQHCCLRYVSNEKMTNQSLRERFQIEEKNAAIVSRIISETVNEGLIKNDDPRSKKFAKYVPHWA
ncbi:MAG: putative DNA binding domain-containing protein [Neisseria sp.]|nr:putative DNA binding domain-containing protein [Neisseria sp.]